MLSASLNKTFPSFLPSFLATSATRGSLFKKVYVWLWARRLGAKADPINDNLPPVSRVTTSSAPVCSAREDSHPLLSSDDNLRVNHGQLFTTEGALPTQASLILSLYLIRPPDISRWLKNKPPLLPDYLGTIWKEEKIGETFRVERGQRDDGDRQRRYIDNTIDNGSNRE